MKLLRDNIHLAEKLLYAVWIIIGAWWLHHLYKIYSYPRFDWFLFTSIDSKTATFVLLFGIIVSIILFAIVFFIIKFVYNVVFSFTIGRFLPSDMHGLVMRAIMIVIFVPLYLGAKHIKAVFLTARYQVEYLSDVARSREVNQFGNDAEREFNLRMEAMERQFNIPPTQQEELE